ncbi:MAG: hypothetical protein Q9164_004619 [Protoblastenia rupestris]
MSTIVPSYRPQTIKQAKRAYRKSSAKFNLSASELAVIERRAVLQERADRIREREARRKANVGRKEERKDRERETMIKMGKPLPVEGGIKVGPSQLDLTRFLPVSGKGDDEEKEMEQQRVERLEESVLTENIDVGKTKTQDTTTSMAPPPRPASKLLPSNTINRSLTCKAEQRNFSITYEDYNDLFVSNTQIERELSPPSRKSPIRLPKPEMTQAPLPVKKGMDEVWQISTQDLDFTGEFTQVSQHPEPDPTSALFVDPVKTTYNTISYLTFDAGHYNAGELLADISTQDLDFESETEQDGKQQVLANISTQDLFLGDLSKCSSQFRPSSSSSSDFDEGFTDNDLEDLATELELASPHPSAKSYAREPTKSAPSLPP